MKKLKKLMVMVLALVMTMGLMTVSAFADPTVYIKITGVQSQYHTYAAYQIFSGDVTSENDVYKLANPKWGSGIDSSKVEALYTALAGITVSSSSPFTGVSSAEDVANALASNNSDAVAVAFQNLIAGTGSYSSDGGYLASSASATCSTGVYDNSTGTYSYTIDLDGTTAGAGYYLVKDTINDYSSSGEGKDYGESDTFYIMYVAGAVTVAVKEDAPTVTKEIQEDDGTAPWGSYGDFDMNQAIHYRLTGTLSNYLADYSDVGTPYSYVFTDTMSKGLDLADSSGTKITSVSTSSVTVNVYVGGSIDGTATPVTSGYDVSYDTYSGNDESYSGGHELKITIEDINKLNGTGISNLSASSIVVVDYYCILNSSATIGSPGNPNQVQLTYADDPYSTSATAVTAITTNVAFTYALDLTKVSTQNNSTTLSGAKFELYKIVGTGGDAVTYYAKLSGSAGAYTLDGWTTTESEATTIESATGGKFKISGLDAGLSNSTGTTYYLHETEAPAGYTKIANDVSVNVYGSYTDADSDNVYDITTLYATWSGSNYNSSSTSATDGTVSANITDPPANSLPTTGGIGTTILYIIGGILVVFAIVVLVARKRARAGSR